MKTNILNLRLFLIMLGVGFLLTSMITGCKNTANGVGKDIENMGEKIQDKTD